MIIVTFLIRKIENKSEQKKNITFCFKDISFKSTYLDKNSILEIDSGFNKYVTKGITAAIPISSNRAWMIEKKIIIKKKIFSFFSKSFQKVIKIFIKFLI
tara:strand:+ start:691 stop:990 length:300 start_codon:yes stop_codon:yes gene_type:complete